MGDTEAQTASGTSVGAINSKILPCFRAESDSERTNLGDTSRKGPSTGFAVE